MRPRLSNGAKAPNKRVRDAAASLSCATLRAWRRDITKISPQARICSHFRGWERWNDNSTPNSAPTALVRAVAGLPSTAPVPAGSLSDVVFVTKRKTTVEEVNSIFKEEAESSRYRGILKATDDPIVSSDIVKEPYASIVDLDMTRVVDGDLVKVLAWYDNEWGYTSQMIKEALRIVRA